MEGSEAAEWVAGLYKDSLVPERSVMAAGHHG